MRGRGFRRSQKKREKNKSRSKSKEVSSWFTDRKLRCTNVEPK